jgi:hypothetical protein
MLMVEIFCENFCVEDFTFDARSISCLRLISFFVLTGRESGVGDGIKGQVKRGRRATRTPIAGGARGSRFEDGRRAAVRARGGKSNGGARESGGRASEDDCATGREAGGADGRERAGRDGCGGIWDGGGGVESDAGGGELWSAGSLWQATSMVLETMRISMDLVMCELWLVQDHVFLDDSLAFRNAPRVFDVTRR